MPEPSIAISLSTPFEQLQAIIASSVNQAQLEKMVLSKFKGNTTGLEKIQIRPVDIKQQPMLCFVYKYQTKDSTKNYNLADALTEIAAQLDAGFKHLHVNTITHDYQLMVSKKNKVVLAQQQSAQQKITAQVGHDVKQDVKHDQATKTPAPVAATHNRIKHRYIEQSRPFLQQLGVTDAQGQVIPAMSRKWKQINKFLEIFAGALQHVQLENRESLSVVDFGSGKGYLTFAVHDFINQQLHKQANVTGVELRHELVEFCNQVGQNIAAKGITFYQGDVRSFTPERGASEAALHPSARRETRSSKVDVMIALHACDIATDYALHTGIRLNAAVIMCAPCCHKEIRPQLKMPALLKPMLQYGVHLGQQAEMLTDSMRALLLEAHGYETKVFEFVALEHTSKNKMILAIKKQASPHKQAEIMQKVQALKTFYGIDEQCLERLLNP